MGIKLKERTLKNGDISLYLEYYLGYSKDKSGKIIHNRKKENLDIYIVNKPVNAFQRLKNKEARALADKMLTKRLAETNEHKFEIFSQKKLDGNLVEYFDKIKETKFLQKVNVGLWINTTNHLRKYCNPATTKFRHVNEDFAIRFKTYLLKDAGINHNTAAQYFGIFKVGIRAAVKEGIFRDNPILNVNGLSRKDSIREYLTVEELQNLANAKCDNQILKNAFLFACYTGLRWIDVFNLRWKEIVKENNQYKLIFRQQKTDSVEYFPLSKQAVIFLGDPGEKEMKVFPGLKYTTEYLRLMKWCIAAGIQKKLTFHMARHTFATLMINSGADLYTVSKLLGHKFIKTTEIYAKIMDKTKQEAVNKMPEIKIQ